jgi:hypothetical protein
VRLPNLAASDLFIKATQKPDQARRACDVGLAKYAATVFILVAERVRLIQLTAYGLRFRTGEGEDQRVQQLQ